MITNENYEGYLMRYIDGELNQQEIAEVEAYLGKHPELHLELDAVSDASLRVTAPPVTMPGKERMLHRFPLSAFRFPLRGWSAAAAVALFIIAGAIMRSFSTSGTPASPTAVVSHSDSLKLNAVQSVSDSIPFDSLYINPAQKPPVYLAANTSNTDIDTASDTVTNTELPTIPNNTISQDSQPLLAEVPQPSRNIRIVGGTIIVETDNLVEIEPAPAPSSNPNAIRGYTIENSQLAMEDEKGIVGRAVEFFVRRLNRQQINDTLLAYTD
ncbi:MAG: hypothetical protein IJK07_08405 [Bacteroidales bacterium]|nr:hypothetical protein [Bacteroidales bacterium]